MKTNEKLLVVSFAKLDEIVIETLEKKTGRKCDEIYAFPKPTAFSLRKTHLLYIKIAFRALLLRRNYHHILFWQQFIGLYYNLMCSVLFSRDFPQSTILTVIFIRRHTLLGIFHHFLYKLAFRSKYINKIICHSSSERNYYLSLFGRDLNEKVVFCKVGEGISKDSFDLTKQNSEERYFFAGGKSNRDYKSLVEAFSGLKERLVIACKPENIRGYKIPPNVTLIFNAYREDFLNLIKNSYSVIVPIKDPSVSAGQLVLLTAMRFGKSSIVTEGSMDDYICPKFALKVPVKSVEKIREAVILLSENPKVNKKMGMEAYKTYRMEYSISKYSERIAFLIN